MTVQLCHCPNIVLNLLDQIKKLNLNYNLNTKYVFILVDYINLIKVNLSLTG